MIYFRDFPPYIHSFFYSSIFLLFPFSSIFLLTRWRTVIAALFRYIRKLFAIKIETLKKNPLDVKRNFAFKWFSCTTIPCYDKFLFSLSLSSSPLHNKILLCLSQKKISSLVKPWMKSSCFLLMKIPQFFLSLYARKWPDRNHIFANRRRHFHMHIFVIFNAHNLPSIDLFACVNFICD